VPQQPQPRQTPHGERSAMAVRDLTTRLYPDGIDQEPVELLVPDGLRAELLRRPTVIAGIPIDFPFGLAPSIATKHPSLLKSYARLGFDILTFKTVRSHEQGHHSSPLWLKLDDDTSISEPFDRPVFVAPDQSVEHVSRLSTANSIGIPSEAPSKWRQDVADFRRFVSDGQVLVVSVVASDNVSDRAIVDDFVAVAQQAKASGAQIIEANLSCPNTPRDTAGQVFQSPIQAGKVAKAMKEALDDTPLFVKIGYLPSQPLEELFLSVRDHVDGIVAINTISAPVIYHSGRQAFPGLGRLRAGVSGRAIKPWAMKVSRDLVALRDSYYSDRRCLSIIAVGGVSSRDDVFEYLAMGVDAVESCTSACINPYIALTVRTNDPSSLPATLYGTHAHVQ
jgi:dihydroorotate dehydrogenase (NAD+) catalytic subunit